MSNEDLVSVILPVYNGQGFIAKTLNSVLSQTYQNLEIILVDDGSTDQTADIVRSFIKKDRRITLLSQSNAGVAAARNLAIRHSQGEFIAPIDADDIWYPENIEKQVQLIEQADRSVGLTYAWSAYIDETDALTRESQTASYQGEVYLPLVLGNFVGNASAVLIRRCCLEDLGGYNSELKAQNAQGCEDWELYLRIAKHYQFGVVPEFLIGYRQVTGSMSCNHAVMYKSYQLMMSDVQKLNPQIPLDIYKKSQINYYRYLLSQSRRSGDHQGSLSWLYEIFTLDLIFFLKNQLYKLFFISFFKLIAQPFTSLIWQNHLTWLKFKHMLKLRKTPMTLVELNEKVVRNHHKKNLNFNLKNSKTLQKSRPIK